jgi:hypothetical protein
LKSRIFRHLPHSPLPPQGAQAAGSGAQALGASQAEQTGSQRLQANSSFSPPNKSIRQRGAHGPQVGSGQHALAHGAQACGAAHAVHPPALTAIMPSMSSTASPWLQRAALSMSAPKTIVHFIEQTLLYLELR